MSSWGEAFPNVLGEAMACGVPCVSTDVGDSALIVGGNGIIVPPRNPQALANGLNSLLAMKAKERAALGAAARDSIRSRFSLGDLVRKYTELYEKVTIDM